MNQFVLILASVLLLTSLCFGANPGDLNHSGSVDLIDAIQAMKVTAGISLSSEDIFTDADVNKDNRIGLEEAIYALQVIAGIRLYAAQWQPAISDTWQWQLIGTVKTTYNVKVYDVDLFDTPTSIIDELHGKGTKIVCHFSAGSAENWRPDFSRFQSSDMGNALDEWGGEYWLDTRSANVRQIMTERMDLAKATKCDGVGPDNVDGFANDTGFTLTAATQIEYNRFLSDLAHARDLAIGLKNDVAQLADLVANFDFAVNERCHEFDECDAYNIFVNVGKPVFNAEYADKYVKNTGGARDALCQDSLNRNLRTLILPKELDGSFRYSCDE